MTTTSTIPVMLDALEDLLAAEFTTAGVDDKPVQVTQGTPRYPERERVEIGDVQNAPQEWGTLGGLVHRSEEYVLTGWVIVSAFPESQRGCKSRAFDLLEIVEQAVRVEDPFGLVADYAYLEVQFGGVVSARGAPYDDGWAYEIQWTVKVEATI